MKRIRRSNPQVNLYSANVSLGAKVIGRLSSRKAEELVRCGFAIRIDLSDGTVAYQEREYLVFDADIPRSTIAALSRAEVEAIAGRHFKGGENLNGNYGPPGRSRTSGLNELQRAKRVLKGLPAEDFVERSEAKLQAWNKLRHEVTVLETAEP